MSAQTLYIRDRHLVPNNVMVWQGLANILRTPTAPCPQKNNGLAMSAQTLYNTDRHLVPKNTIVRQCLATAFTSPIRTLNLEQTMVGPCPPKPFTSPKDTLCPIMQWTGHVWPTPLEHRPLPCP